MNFLKNYEKSLIYLILLSIIIFGIYLCYIGGYGSDEDTLPMIYVFETKLTQGRFVSSRFTGNPVAELGIGFLSYFFGSFVANIFTYLFLLFGLVIFFYSFQENIKFEKLYFFLFLCLTNPILFFDNLEPVDYSWAFFFFSLGIFFFSRKLFELSILFFALSIGVRINYVLFVLFIILFYHFDDKISIPRRIGIFISAFIFGGLFYLPIWYENNFNLSWLTAARPTSEGLIGILARFTYKTYISVGYLSSFFVIFYFTKNLKILKSVKNIKSLFLLCLANLLIFLWIPAEFSYLQLFLVIISFLIFDIKKKFFYYLVCIGNLFSWIIFFSPVNIHHYNEEICAPKNAKSVSINISLEKGFYYKYIDSRDMIKCWARSESERDKRILKGDALKID